MHSIHTKPAFAMKSGTVSQNFGLNVRSAASTQGHDNGLSMPSGWWLLPAILLGAAIWGWALTALFI